MAYIDRSTASGQRVATMAVVAALQGAVIVALINGLAVKFIAPTPIPNPKTEDVSVTVPLPPPPPPKPPADARERQRDPRPTIPLGSPDTRDPLPPIPLPPLPLPPDPVPSFTPGPLPSPTATPRAPRPRNAPGGWATPNDYPARDLREGNQGVTRFSLAIGPDGRVQRCTIIAGSGFAGLDRATCDNVSRRARFDPATDGGGNRVAGVYSGSIRWEIPD